MLTLAKSTRARTCQSCGGIIPKDTVHIEARGGPAENRYGNRNGWVHYHHTTCTRHSCSVNATEAFQRRQRRRVRATRPTPASQPRRKRPWRS